MADVKSVIALLCKHLKLSFNVNIKPEHFRLAKFDRTEDNTVCQLWEIAYKICSEIYPSLVEDDVVNFVKMSLAMLGYNSLELYCLPVDMSSGSRELLLALGWLLVTQNVLEHSVTKSLRVSQLNMEFDRVEQGTVETIKEHIYKSGSLESYLNSILWFAGKIRLNVNAIAELDEARIAFASKVHRGSVNASGLPHLSVSETKFVRYPQLLPQYLNEVTEKSVLIETHRQWGKKSHVFWEWMESVVLEKQSKAVADHLSVDQKKTLFLVLDVLRNKLNALLLKCQRLNSENVNGENDSSGPPTIQGMPRCVFQPKDKDTEMEQLLMESECQLKEVQNEFTLKEAAVKLQLHDIAKQMENAVVLFPQELK